MNNLLIVVVVILIIAGGYYIFSNNVTNIQEEAAEVQTELAVVEEPVNPNDMSLQDGPSVHPISHASVVFSWDGSTIYVDPIGAIEEYGDYLAPDIVLLTHGHSDHLNVETIDGIIAANTQLVVPQAVYDELPSNLRQQATVMSNGETLEVKGFNLEAVPMYNLPEATDSFHPRGWGNGYIMEQAGVRVYIAGDTSGIPEMRRLQNIYMAFVPMNLPFTMPVDEAAEVVLEFAPQVAVPYHYRGKDGFADVARFKELVESANPDIDVLLLNWYPDDGETEE